MKDRRLLAAVIAFLIITALKMLFPFKNQEIRKAMTNIIEGQSNYIQLAEAIGRDFGKEGFEEKIWETVKNNGREDYVPVEVIKIEAED